MTPGLHGFLAAMVAVPLAVPATPPPPPSPFTCTYDLRQWPGGFTAELAVANAGPTIDGWTVRWSFTAPTRITALWSTTLTQPTPTTAVALPAPWNQRISTGHRVSFGWSAMAPSTEVPTDITVNTSPCAVT